MRCPKCGAGLTWNGSFWYCQFCHREVAKESALCKTLDKFCSGGETHAKSD